MVPAINLITGFVMINIFKRLSLNYINTRGKREIPQALLCYCIYVISCCSVFGIQAQAMGKSLGVNLRVFSGSNQKASWVAFLILGLTTLWASYDQVMRGNGNTNKKGS